MHVQGEFLVPLLTMFLYSGHVTADSDGEYEIEVKNLGEKPLLCYRCYEYEDNCQSLANVSNIEVSECDIDETFCQVRRLDYREDLQTFERSCSRECTPGCRTMLYRTLCVTCCNSSLCNTDSAAGRSIYSWTVSMVTGPVAVFLFSIWRFHSWKDVVDY